ncbi:Ribosomal RNA large subunit methyltransferase H [Rhynchospora pubera]|uniref:Ribosomal RNA large subunit methyltransferase H n=1 Tax=Rhynchospora pubera TaxID=906938 RepID=A0AAV8HGX5_9POAL|nr:Ribosomal RNA large subunit methyltransferase H [Rhynchospora pubera]
MALCWCQSSASLSLKKKIAPSQNRKSKYEGQSIVAIPIRVLTVGKRRSKGTQLLVEEYAQKIKYYCNIEDTLIKSNPKATSDVRSQIEAEDMLMVQHTTPDDFIVMMDENGKDIVSEEMADLIGDAANKGVMRLTFCIGGPYGHGPLVRERADMSIRLSSLVLNHQVALIVLLEQIYSVHTYIRRCLSSFLFSIMELGSLY